MASTQDTLQLFQRTEKEFPLNKVQSYQNKDLDPITRFNHQSVLSMAHAAESLYFDLFVRAKEEESRETFATLGMMAHHNRCVLLAMTDPTETPIESLYSGELGLIYNYSNISQVEPNTQVKTLFQYFVFDHLDHLHSLKKDFQKELGESVNTFLQDRFHLIEGRPFNQQQLTPKDVNQGPLQNHVDAITWANIIGMKAMERHAHSLYLNCIRSTKTPETRTKLEQFGMVEIQHAQIYGSCFKGDLNDLLRLSAFEYSKVLNLRRVIETEPCADHKATYQKMLSIAETCLQTCNQFATSIGKQDTKSFVQSGHEKDRPTQTVDAYLNTIKDLRTKRVTPKMTISMMPEERAKTPKQ
ncbi:MAG TPA: hypothetical protein DD435_07325 [Cyanobacteria bacterium UBA8530]|nr:hypothetical protein [Cyanobacteria bacterium UBA8530]